MNDGFSMQQVSRSTSQTSRAVALVASAIGLLGILLLLGFGWWVFFSSHPIKLTATSAPSEKGWQIAKEPFWARAEAVGTLPPEAQWYGLYVIAVFRQGVEKPFYFRSIDPGQIQAGRPFDLALKKRESRYNAAFVEYQNGGIVRRLSNTLSCAHRPQGNSTANFAMSFPCETPKVSD